MDLVVVTVATALGVLIRGDEVVAGEGVGGAALTGPSTRRGGAPTKSSRAAGRSPEVGWGGAGQSPASGLVTVDACTPSLE